MAQLKFNIHSNIEETLGKKLAAASTPAEHAVAIQVAKDTEPFVPELTKSLKDRTKIDGGYIIYPGPYARFLYYGKLMIDPATGSAWAPKGASKVVTNIDLNLNHSGKSQAQAHWFEASKAQNMDKWIRIAKKAVKRELKK